MSATVEPTRSHPVHAFASRLHEVLDGVLDCPIWSLTTTERVQVITELHAAEARLAALKLAVIGEVDRADDATVLGATGTPGLLRELVRVSGADATRSTKLARAMADRTLVATGLAAGSVSVAQAHVITAAVAALPDEHQADGEAYLVGLTGDHDDRELRALGKHLLAVVAPDLAEQELAKRVEAEEARAARDTFLEMWDDGKGKCHGRFEIPSLHGAILKAITDAFLNPARPTPITGDTRAEARGSAFCQMLEAYPTHKAPRTGGGSATVVIPLDLDTLLGGLKTAGILGTDLQISAREARRLACQHGIIPVVCDSESRVLDLGRRRFHDPHQRFAMAYQQGGTCGIDRCDRPAAWCDAHHQTAYAAGGTTTVADGLLLCPRHHTLAHDLTLEMKPTGSGKHRFHRRE